MASNNVKSNARKGSATKGVAESLLTAQANSKDEDMDKIVMAYLTKKGYANAQSALKKDSKNVATLDQITLDNLLQAEADVTNYVLFYNSAENNPRRYSESYTEIRSWIEGALEMYRVELSKVLYPLFVHSYLNLVSRGYLEEARQFMARYKKDHLKSHQQEVNRLAGVTLPQHCKENDLVITLRTCKISMEISQPSFELLINHLQEKGHMLMLAIVNQYIHMHVVKGNPKDDEDALQAKMVLTGEHIEEVEEANAKDILWGTLEEHPEVKKQHITVADDDKAKLQPKKKVKVGGSGGAMSRGKLNDVPVKPARDRIPLPEMSDEDIAHRIQVLKELRQAVSLGPTSLCSVCMYTMHNTYRGLSSITFSDDIRTMATSFQDSRIRVWSLTGEKLYSMKEGANLKALTQEGALEGGPINTEDLFDMDTGTQSKTLLGHSGPVYGTSFSPENRFLLSCSEDTTVRLWSLQTYTNLVCYKGHNYPVWDVEFSPMGYYFVSGSYDRTARVWATDQIYPVRIFAGHTGDVDCVAYHPNCNYVATGSSDKSCRLWDLLHKNGCVRLFADHKAPVNCIALSPCGRYLASAGEDKTVVLWDIGEGTRMATFVGHEGAVNSVAFSKDSSVLASGSADNTIRLWRVKTSPPSSTTSPQLLALPTKSTPVMSVRFTRQNLLVGAGCFTPTS